jgi:F0F1-type ATP synthase membrane subunit b/b'
VTKRLLMAAVLWCAALPAWAAGEGSGRFLGLPPLFWSTANLLVFVGLLVYFLARPLSRFFHARREQITSQMREAAHQQQEAERLRSEMEQRVAALSGEIEALKVRLRREGERDRGALERQGEEEAARLVAQIGQEVARRVAEARQELASEAASVAADLALELLQGELTPEDRERIFRETLERLTVRAGRGAQ